MESKPLHKLVDALFKNRWDLLPSEPRTLSAIFPPGEAGVYLLAYPKTGRNLKGKLAKPKDVHYVGMTISKHGLRGRLKGFIRSANGKSLQHSAGVEFLRRNKDRPYASTHRQRPLFFITYPIRCCTIKSEVTADDLYEMGNVAALEFYAIARVKEAAKEVPSLNRSVGGELNIG